MIEEMKKRVNDDGVDLVVDVGIHLTSDYILFAQFFGGHSLSLYLLLHFLNCAYF